MGIIKRAGDLVYTFRFLKLLVTDFEDTEAYKAGIITADGKRDKSYDIDIFGNRDKLNNYYTPFHRLVFNVKRLIAKAPGGSSKIASYAAALYLLREKYSISNNDLYEGLKRLGIDSTDMITEGSEWFVLEDNRLSPGLYRIRNNKCLNKSLDEVVYEADQIRVEKNSYPVGEIFGLNVYEVTHMRTQQKIYTTVEEIVR
jgi:hypothetical protein|tara:strand:- start:155 stop:754 length:600 start_codon:yes stop_codon:yes gene_type:complete